MMKTTAPTMRLAVIGVGIMGSAIARDTAEMMRQFSGYERG